MVFWIKQPASWLFLWSTIITLRLTARKHWLASTTLIITPTYWFADETGKLTPMKLPSGYELCDV